VRGDLFVLFLFVVCFYPLPEILQGLVFCGLLENQGEMSMYQNHRWYLSFYLVCRLLHYFVFSPLAASIRMWSSSIARRVAPLLVVCLFLSSYWNAGLDIAHAPNMCPGVSPTSMGFRLMQVLLPGSWAYPDGTKCPLYYSVLTPRLFLVYAIVWWFGEEVATWATDRLGRAAWPWMTAFVGIVMLFGNMDDSKDFRQPGPGGPFGRDVLDFTTVCVLSLGVWLQRESRWLRASWLTFAGQYSLGTYLLHEFLYTKLILADGTQGWGVYFFSFRGSALIPDLAELLAIVAPYGAAAKLGLLLAYPFVFMVLFGPTFQIAMFAAFSRLDTEVVSPVCQLMALRGRPQTPRSVRSK